MFTVVITTAIYDLVGTNRGELKALTTEYIPGFATLPLANAAAGSLQIKSVICERTAWSVRMA